MKLNKVGMILGGVYAGYFSLLMCLCYFTDDKGAYILAQFSVLPAFGPLSWTGLIEFLPKDSWLNSMWVFFSISLTIVYLIGLAISAAIWPKNPSAPSVDAPLDSQKH